MEKQGSFPNGGPLNVIVGLLLVPLYAPIKKTVPMLKTTTITHILKQAFHSSMPPPTNLVSMPICAPIRASPSVVRGGLAPNVAKKTRLKPVIRLCPLVAAERLGALDQRPTRQLRPLRFILRELTQHLWSLMHKKCRSHSYLTTSLQTIPKATNDYQAI